MKEIILKAVIDNLKQLTDFIDKNLDAVNCPVKVRLQIDVIVDELFANIANYAYSPGTGDVLVRVHITRDPLVAEITFIDMGMRYNPLDKPDPDVHLSADERAIGGLGIFMVKKSVDDISYEYKDEKNILKIIKKLR